MITRGQMAPDTNQHGYDVVSAENERISVKTITSSQHVTFKKSTFEWVDRVMVLRLIVDDDHGLSIENLLDLSSAEASVRLVETEAGFRFNPNVARKPAQPIDNLRIAAKVHLDGFEILQFENGTVRVLQDGEIITPAKPVLRQIAGITGLPIYNENENEKNTRQLGSELIRQIPVFKSERKVFDALARVTPVSD